MKKHLSFSQRMGIKPVSKIFQKDSMDADLRTGLWNAFYIFYKRSDANRVFWSLWINFFKNPIDEGEAYFEFSDSCSNIRDMLKETFFNFTWNEVYDFIEFIYKNFKDDEFKSLCNEILQRENAAYRFVGDEITPIISDEEIKEIEQALKIEIDEPKIHLEEALKKLSDRKRPDYRNSIKESISAVEATCRKLVGECIEFSKALETIKKRQLLKIHPALEQAFKKLYGYTSDASGIRHSLFSKEENSEVGFDEAKFMLVACSAFVNYIVSKMRSEK